MLKYKSYTIEKILSVFHKEITKQLLHLFSKVKANKVYQISFKPDNGNERVFSHYFHSDDIQRMKNSIGEPLKGDFHHALNEDNVKSIFLNNELFFCVIPFLGRSHKTLSNDTALVYAGFRFDEGVCPWFTFLNINSLGSESTDALSAPAEDIIKGKFKLLEVER